MNELVPHMVTVAENEILIRIPLEDEIKATVWELHPLKSSSQTASHISFLEIIG